MARPLPSDFSPGIPTDVVAERTVSEIPAGYREVRFLVRQDYLDFFSVLFRAYEQTAIGKGADRHGGSIPWDEQPLRTELQLQDHPGFAIGQARKKLLESLRLSRLSPTSAKREVLGAIVYAVALFQYYDAADRKDLAAEVSS
jgi:hypothetical protein